MRYRLARQAGEDLVRIADYLARNSADAPERVLDGLFETFELLGEFPMMGTLRDDLRPNLRLIAGKRPAQNYLVFYYPLEDGIEIATIIHGARDFPSVFQG